MKKALTILMLAISLAAFSQNATKVIILDTFNKDGRISYSTKVVLKSDLGKAVSGTPNFESIVNDEVDAMLFNAGFQQNPRLSKEQTEQIVKMTGVPYALLSEASIDEQEQLTVTTSLVDLVAYTIIDKETAYMSNTPNDILHGCEVLAMKMLFKVPTAQETIAKAEPENPASNEKPKLSKTEQEEIDKSYDFVAQQQYQKPQSQQPQSQPQSQPQQYQQQYQQQYFPTGGKMKRKGKNLVLNDRKLTYEDVSQIFSYEDVLTYRGARSNIENGNVMCGVFFADLGVTIFLNSLRAISGHKTSKLDVVLNAINGVILNYEFASWIINKAIGKGRLNYLVDTYNNGQARNVNYSFSPAIIQINELGSDNQNFGYGATFTISF